MTMPYIDPFAGDELVDFGVDPELSPGVVMTKPQILPPISVSAPGPTVLVPHVIDTVSVLPSQLVTAPMAAPAKTPWWVWGLLAVGAYFVLSGKAGRRRMSW